MWSEKPLLKSWQKTKPTLGWPRTTDSLCPKCIPEARDKILNGDGDVKTLVNEKVGEIKAQIIERDGEIRMIKDCPIHGHFEDLMAVDVEFFKHLENVFPGRDIRAHNDEKLHDHGSSTIKHGRGSVLTIDLTNRCNMMCDPCFMDANQVGFVHELSWDDIKTLLDNAATIKPKRQMSVQFSGGEPTLSPYFLDAVRYARKIGYISTQAATNGIEFAKSPEFAREAAAAGLRYAYLQFDGIGNAANSHRHVGNLFDVKLQAIENLYANGVDIVPVTTLINGVNNEQVGSLVRFALDNPKKIPFLAFQPVSFTGRDEAVTDDRRFAQRYTLSHLAHDVKNMTGLGEPARDWYPISFLGTFSDWADLVHGPGRDWGQFNCGCHPNCGVGMAIMVDKETKESAPVTSFLNGDRLAEDVKKMNDAARGRFLSGLGMALSVMRNYNPFKAPTHFTLLSLLEKFDKTYGITGRDYGKVTPDQDVRGHREAPQGSLEFPVHRRHVVPGSVQLRLPPHRAVHHPVRDPGRRDLLLCVQHRHRLAPDCREDAHERDAQQVVRRAWPPPHLRRQQGRQPAHRRPLALAPARTTSPRASRRISTRRASPRTARDEVRLRRATARCERTAEDERMEKLLSGASPERAGSGRPSRRPRLCR